MLTRAQTPSPLSNVDTIKPETNLDDKGLAAWVQTEYRRMKNDRNALEQEWYYNLAMYRGNQYVEQLKARGGTLYTPPAPRSRVRLVINRIRPVIRTELARVTSQKPSASVIPASSEDEDLFAAYAGEQVWEAISGNARGKLDLKFSQAAFWTLVFGTGFIKTYWDKSVEDKDSQQMGDVRFAAVSPFQLLVPDILEPDIQEQPYVFNVYTRNTSWVFRNYGVSVPPDVTASKDIMDNAYLNFNRAGVTEQAPNSVLCIEAWFKPGGCDYLPNGGMVQIFGDQVVAASRDGIPYTHGEFPFAKLDHIPDGGFYSTSVIRDIISPQKEYNRTRSQIIESKNRMARPQLSALRGSVDASKITNEPGQVIEYNIPGSPPQPIPLLPLPNYVIQELDRTLADIEDLTGQHAVSRGGVPPGVTAATAISYLQEKDDSLISHTYQSIERAMECIARQTLQLAVQYWDTQRLVRVAGTDGFFDVLELTGAKLQSGTDIRMEGGSSLPTSKAAKQALIMDLMKMGFIDPNDGLRILEIGGVNKLYANLKRDESQAQRENIKLKKIAPEQIQQADQEWEMQEQMGMGSPDSIDPQTGQPLQRPLLMPVHTYDNHDVHIKTHNDFRKTQAFEMLSPEVQAEFEDHVNAHLLAVEQAYAQVSAMTGGMGMPGTGPNGVDAENPQEEVDPMEEQDAGTPPPMMG
jgi:hypothetical protein